MPAAATGLLHRRDISAHRTVGVYIVACRGCLAFAAGIAAADPHATGTYTWKGIDDLESSVTYTFVDGHGDWVGGAWTPLAWVLWAVATILVGRLWRVVTYRRSPAPTG
jgi:hypothetical protein